MTREADQAEDDQAEDAPQKRPGRPRRAGLDEEILEVAARLLSEVGYARLSIEMVAQQVGVGKPTLYRRWPSKAALTLDVLINAAPPAVPMRAPRQGSFKEFLKTNIFGYYHALASSEIIHVMPSIASEVMLDTELGVFFRERFLAPRRQLLEQLFQQGIDKGVLRADLDPWLMYKMVSGPTFYTLLLEGQVMSEKDTDLVFEEIWKVISVRPAGRARRAAPTPPVT
jgi:AcrR family transcriptional regulator